jgi:hypothetical protein
VALWKGTPPDTQGSFFIEFDATNMQDGDIHEIVFAWEDEDNYWFMRFESDDTNNCRMSIGQVSGGVETSFDDHTPKDANCDGVHLAERQDPPIQPPQFLSFIVTYDRATIQANTISDADTGDLWKCVNIDVSGGRRIGMRHNPGNTGSIYFSRFFFSDHYVHDRTCPDYGCHVDWSCMPDTLVGSYVHVSGPLCEQLEEDPDIEFHRLFPRDLASPSREWIHKRMVEERYPDPDDGFQCDGYDWYHQINLVCGVDQRDEDGSDLGQFSIGHQMICYPGIPIPDDCKIDGVQQLTWTLVRKSVDPLELVFQGYPPWPICQQEEEPGLDPDPVPIYELIITEPP